jgi:Ring finger domain
MSNTADGSGCEGDVLRLDREGNYDDDINVPQCLICFESYVNGDEIVRHCTTDSYHRHCIIEWLLRNDNCPYCRRPFLSFTTSDDQK